MKDELFINGEQVDLYEDSGVYLDYNSQVLSSLDEIEANHSYTIKLPKTATNLRLIGGFLYPSTESSFPQAKNVCSLFRDGVPLCQGATLYLIKVEDDEISVAITWGIGDILDVINDLSIRDTAWAKSTELVWRGGLMEDGRRINCLWALNGLDGEYQHTAVYVKEIMAAINDETGGLLEYDETRFDDFVVPILLRVPKSINDEYTADVYISHLYRDDLGSSSSVQGVNFWYLGNVEVNNESFEILQYNEHDAYVRIPYGWIGIIRMNCQTDNGTAYIAVQRLQNLEWTTVAQYNASYSSADRCYYIRNDFEVDASDGGYTVRFASYYGPNSNNMFTSSVIEFIKDAEEMSDYLATPLLDSGAEPTDANILPLSKNLPDISCADFIKSVCGMFGLFPCLVGDKVVLTPLEELETREYDDFSQFLCSSSEEPSELMPTDDGLGQRNKFFFQNDEDEPQMAGYVYVLNNYLEKEVDYFESQTYAAANYNDKYAEVPLYTQVVHTDEEKEEEEWEFEEIEDCYILKIVDYTESAITPQYWLYSYSFQTYLSEFYPNATSLLSGRIIQEKFHIPSAYLKDIDLTKPIYLDKYGRRFIILEIKTKDNDMQEVKLLCI